ncbi:uncharacterized protein LOC120426929 [Culex pipiens pallens]|uniref:uncharacterized protein LOC120426929 n=1 Tax=Culex pipiens pallens TaxID=42434 RepID=UPI0019531D73|nr:uncharacterized protein LOC120426929 [Culex pipiens pallens]
MKSSPSTMSVCLVLAVTVAIAGAAQTLYHPGQQQTAQLRSIYDSLPELGQSSESFLQYCEAVIHALESELPRKSVFRSLFIDKARLSSGYDKHIKFTYYDILKNQINDQP